MRDELIAAIQERLLYEEGKAAQLSEPLQGFCNAIAKTYLEDARYLDMGPGEVIPFAIGILFALDSIKSAFALLPNWDPRSVMGLVAYADTRVVKELYLSTEVSS